MNCLQCGIEIEQTGKRPKVYCSDRCRMSYKRTSKANRIKSEHKSEQNFDTGLSGYEYDIVEVFRRMDECDFIPVSRPGDVDYSGVLR